MSTYFLKIVTPDKVKFEGEAESLVARTINGDVCILARHTEYIAPLSIGIVKVKQNGEYRRASCSGGTLVVSNSKATLVADTFEWEDEIDLERAERAKAKAEERIANHQTDFELKIAELKLKRAINRIRTGSR
ncbi:MAG: ATP synthase F1 subunit epsilon [Clostridia bacterium]